MSHFIVPSFTPFIITLISQFLTPCYATGGTIKIWHSKIPYHWSDGSTSYDVSKCNSLLNETRNGTILGIETEGLCVNLYKEETDCHGPFIRFAGRSDTGILSTVINPHTYKWSDDGILTKELLQAASVGPCFDMCDSRNWEGDTGGPVTVTLYSQHDHEGNQTTLQITGNDCYLIPPQPAGSYSIRISGDESSCIELHEEPNCAWNFTQLRPGYLELNNLADWSLGGFAWDSPKEAKAVARCGSHCGRKISDVNPASLAQPGKNVVTIYSGPGYYGHGTDVNLSDGCVNLERRAMFSVRSYGTCVVVYATPNCTQAERSWRTSGESVDYYQKKLSALTILYERLSIKMCDEQDVKKVRNESIPRVKDDEAPCQSVLLDWAHFMPACLATCLVLALAGVLFTILYEFMK